jgi:uncharacterized membrane protein YgcG
MNYKNIKTGVVISSHEYYRLPHHLQIMFVGSYDTITHYPSGDEGDFDWLSIALGISIVNEIFDNSSSVGGLIDDSDDNSSSSNSDFSGFGGGDFGGGGAGSDF